MKIAYKDEATAVAASDVSARAATVLGRRGQQKPLRAYRCFICHKWHLTSRLNVA